PGVKDSGSDPVMATLSLNLPIWQGKYRAAQREAEARHSATVNQRIERENGLIVDAQLAAYNFRDAERKINLYRDTLLPKAEESLNVSQQGFAAGTVGFLDLIDAQRVLLEFQISCERALANRAQKLAELEMLIGKEIPRSEPNSSP
ncbi:MAG: TolC family protein, partial [bacterium]